ncbi:FHA domain-containing protein, partial [uncultured Parolsenella sp.]|uniref:FHA domain-containing protein n=1 Tax=uncultured Parolsenella sp. TaxID=2083008 RepID=UPI0027DE7D1E
APAAPVAPATCLLIDRQSGRTYTAAAPRTIVGRERTPGGVVLHDPNVSRSHAELSHDGQGWRIRDLNSTNGTLVNDVDVDECPLRDGDLITLGLTNLEFREN